MKLTKLLFWIVIADIIFLGLRYLVVNLMTIKHVISYDSSIVHPAAM